MPLMPVALEIDLRSRRIKRRCLARVLVKSLGRCDRSVGNFER